MADALGRYFAAAFGERPVVICFAKGIGMAAHPGLKIFGGEIVRGGALEAEGEKELF